MPIKAVASLCINLKHRIMRTYESTARLVAHTLQKLRITPSELSRRLNRSTSTVGRYVHGQACAPNEVLQQLATMCGYESLSEFYHHAL